MKLTIVLPMSEVRNMQRRVLMLAPRFAKALGTRHSGVGSGIRFAHGTQQAAVTAQPVQQGAGKVALQLVTEFTGQNKENPDPTLYGYVTTFYGLVLCLVERLHKDSKIVSEGTSLPDMETLRKFGKWALELVESQSKSSAVANKTNVKKLKSTTLQF